mmetsp:Transcript_9380/g.14188  ORF Transcript_9380/g.14188 Transcript_9380/m.14188 type:complete len:106 (+) Transcript_9380:340-657(+)
MEQQEAAGAIVLELHRGHGGEIDRAPLVELAVGLIIEEQSLRLVDREITSLPAGRTKHGSSLEKIAFEGDHIRGATLILVTISLSSLLLVYFQTFINLRSLYCIL